MIARRSLCSNVNFKSASWAFRAASANSILACAAFIWTKELAKVEKDLPKRVKNMLKKIFLTAAFTADSSFDTMQYFPRAMAENISAHHAIRLRNWKGDSGSQSKLTNIPFEGRNLFGSTMEPILVESKDKKKSLPLPKKDPPRPRPESLRSFRSCRSTFYSSGQCSSQMWSQWTNPHVLPRSRGHNGKST